MMYFCYSFALSLILAFPLVALGVVRFAMRRSFDVDRVN